MEFDFSIASLVNINFSNIYKPLSPANYETIDDYTLDAGMYLYSLIADGKELDTKKMILTK